jgi:hypothetical protein
MKIPKLLFAVIICIFLTGNIQAQMEGLFPHTITVFERANEIAAWQKVNERKTDCKIFVLPSFIDIQGDHNLFFKLEKRVQELKTKEFNGYRWQAYDLKMEAKCHVDLMVSNTGKEAIMYIIYIFMDKEQLIKYESNNFYLNLKK